MKPSKHFIVILVALLAAFGAVLPSAHALDADGGNDAAAAPAVLAVGTAKADVTAGANAVGPRVSYKGYVGSSWTGAWTAEGKVVGKTGSTLQMFKLKVARAGYTGSIRYRIYSKYKGWQSWASNGTAVGEKGWKFRGVQVKLTAGLGRNFDVMYRVFLHGGGWQPWVLDGGTAGSLGALGQVEKMQVKLVRKGSAQKLSAGAYFLTAATNSRTALAIPDSATEAKVQAAKANYKRNSFDQRFFVRKASGYVLLQSCVSGLYLCESAGKVVQRPLSSAARFRWKVSWDGGYVLANKASGKFLKLSRGKAVSADTPTAWTFTPTDLIANGVYSIGLESSDNLLAVEDASPDSGAGLIVEEEGEPGAEAFSLERVAPNTYRIVNADSRKSLEVKNGSAAEGAAVRQNASKNKDSQKWKAKLDAAGGYAFTNKASGKVLTAKGKGADGASVCSRSDKGLKTQRWRLEASDYEPESARGVQALAEDRAESYASKASSSTNYYITVDLTNNWVCIFKGPSGDRILYKSWQASTGKPSTPTPTGSYTTDYKQYEFGDGYSCYYATAFIGYEYLFHSVKYYKNSSTILDGRLGESVSEGCVRLDIDNAKWIYDNIPTGTKVQIYY